MAVTGTELGLGGLVVGALGVIVSPWTTYWAARLNRDSEHIAWLRERRYEAYTELLDQMREHEGWRARMLNGEPWVEPPRRDVFGRVEVIGSSEVNKWTWFAQRGQVLAFLHLYRYQHAAPENKAEQLEQAKTYDSQAARGERLTSKAISAVMQSPEPLPTGKLRRWFRSLPSTPRRVVRWFRLRRLRDDDDLPDGPDFPSDAVVTSKAQSQLSQQDKPR